MGLRIRNAQQDPFLNAPAFFASAPTSNLILQTVILRIHRGSQEQDTFRELCVIRLPPGQ